MLGYIPQVKAVPESSISTIQSEQQSSVSAREELRVALKIAFISTTFSSDQCSQVLDLCAKYRSVFSLSSSELGKCAIMEADFALQPGTPPVDRNPSGANPRVQEVIRQMHESNGKRWNNRTTVESLRLSCYSCS